MTEQNSSGTYRYETHMHTSEGSACGKSSGAEMAEAYAQAGYAGIIITDHFFNGNCAVSSKLPWRERVEQFCIGYENAAAAGRELGLSVFLGWEYNYCSTEFLTCGLGKEFLLAHEDLLEWDVITYLNTVRAAGGFVSQAHPFRQRDYIQYGRLFYNYVDAVEVYNTADQDAWNDLAWRYAKANDLAMTAGSDSHHVAWPSLAGLGFPRRLDRIEDFVAAMKRREGTVLRDLPNPLVNAPAPAPAVNPS